MAVVQRNKINSNDVVEKKCSVYNLDIHCLTNFKISRRFYSVNIFLYFNQSIDDSDKKMSMESSRNVKTISERRKKYA